MTYKEKLIKFMELKHDIFFKATGIEYFTEKDRKDILKWEDEDCEAIWFYIKSNIYIIGISSISSLSCPFCLYYHSNCKKCTYSNPYIVCGIEEKTMYLIEKFRLNELLANYIYKELLEKIEQYEV